MHLVILSTMIALVSDSTCGYDVFSAEQYAGFTHRLGHLNDVAERSPLVAGSKFSIDCLRRSNATGRPLQRGGLLNLKLVRSLVPLSKTSSRMSTGAVAGSSLFFDTDDAPETCSRLRAVISDPLPLALPHPARTLY